METLEARPEEYYKQERMIAAAPVMYNLLKMYVNGKCFECKERKKVALELLARIDGESNHD